MTDQAVLFAPPMPRRSSLRETLQIQRNVMHALILHGIKARYFGNIYGYLIVLLWPLMHLVILVIVHTLHLAEWYGDSIILYASTATLPLITWHYLTRFVEQGMMNNKSLLNYPIIGPIDLLLSRMLLETMTLFIVICVVLSFMVIIDINIVPKDLTQASLGLLSAVLLGYGFATVIGLLAQFFPGISMFWFCIAVPAHIFSGMTTPVETYPAALQKIVWFNPIMHSIEWIRSSYWSDYPHHMLSKTYVLSVGIGGVALGLGFERITRRMRKIKR